MHYRCDTSQVFNVTSVTATWTRLSCRLFYFFLLFWQVVGNRDTYSRRSYTPLGTVRFLCRCNTCKDVTLVNSKVQSQKMAELHFQQTAVADARRRRRRPCFQDHQLSVTSCGRHLLIPHTARCHGNCTNLTANIYSCLADLKTFIFVHVVIT